MFDGVIAGILQMQKIDIERKSRNFIRDTEKMSAEQWYEKYIGKIEETPDQPKQDKGAK